MTLSPSTLAELRRSVEVLVRTNGEKLARVWQDVLETSQKDIRDVVTTFDTETENVLRTELASYMPDAGFFVEEGESTEAREYMWVIDPIDQTKNFAARLPLFFTQVALMHQNEPILAVIYNPVSKQLFSASHGAGVTLNGIPLSLTPKASLAECIVDVDFGGQDDVDLKTRVFGHIVPLVYRVRMSGGAYAVYLATGGIDAFVVLSQRTKIVDQAPRMLIARELGLRYERVQFGTRTMYVCASPALFAQLSACIEAGF